MMKIFKVFGLHMHMSARAGTARDVLDGITFTHKVATIY
jgi:hypothetical protein